MERLIIVKLCQFLITREEYNALHLLNCDNLNTNILEQIIKYSQNKHISKLENYVERIIPAMDYNTFKSHFRVSRGQFEVILQYIASNTKFLKKDENAFGGRHQITPEKALLITLWTLGTPDSYRSISERFNVCKSSVYWSINTVICVILSDLCPKFIKWPLNVNEKDEIARGFQNFGLINCIGAIDGCHIPIKKPSVNGLAYYNRKQYYSLVLQAVCTTNLMFIDCDIRWPGSVHDARVLRTSDLYPVGEQLCGPHYYIIGDAAYPCRKWLMTPFRNNGHLTEPQIFYNLQLSKTRVKIENSFALLKGRFRRLKDLLDRHNMQDYVNTIIACCVLHNICLIENPYDIDIFLQEGRDDRNILMVGDNALENDNRGVDLRNHIVQSLWHRYHMND